MRKIKLHETSDSHKNAHSHKLRVIFKLQPIEEALAKTLSNEEQKWADFISRLVDVIPSPFFVNIRDYFLDCSPYVLHLFKRVYPKQGNIKIKKQINKELLLEF